MAGLLAFLLGYAEVANSYWQTQGSDLIHATLGFWLGW